MNAAEVHELLETHGAVQSGHFRLSSGDHSDTYIQNAAVLKHPGIAERLGRELGARTAATAPTVVVGPAMGGLIIAHEVARHLDLPMLFSERVEGTMTFRRGFALAPSDRVLIVEDVISTGRSQREVIDLVDDAGATVVGVAAIVDRSSGVAFGVPVHALLDLDAERWPPDACPACERGDPLTTPGSRFVSR